MENAMCPCGSGKTYKECCEPFITGKSQPATAEQLMRSRYSAYEKHEIAYIIDTCTIREEEQRVDPEETRRWSEESQWLGLKILNTEKGQEGDTEGIVEFSAEYVRKGLKDVHLERASFKKESGRWLYDDGSLIPTTIVRAEKKVGRNEPCPCGSGKKYKQCCGRSVATLPLCCKRQPS
ncbi:MAG: YchJ family protein [Spirochaetaceae bacterium]|jgi:SEC-C motif-containing protein|nr:YchJ family protein [Spirochaetaceae bacterium]